MRPRYIATILIALFIIFVEGLWFFISVRYGLIKSSDILGYIPWAFIVFFIPFLIGLAIRWAMVLASSSSIFRKIRFHKGVNKIAFAVALLALVAVVTKKVPVPKTSKEHKIVSAQRHLLVKDNIVSSSAPALQKQEAAVAQNTRVIPTVESTSETLFKAMRNSCFKSHSPDDGFNQVQMLTYCNCVVDDAKLNLTIPEIESITKSLATKSTSGEALLENEAMVGIVVECITKVSGEM